MTVPLAGWVKWRWCAPPVTALARLIAVLRIEWNRNAACGHARCAGRADDDRDDPGFCEVPPGPMAVTAKESMPKIPGFAAYGWRPFRSVDIEPRIAGCVMT